jgi:hypothetical protein
MVLPSCIGKGQAFFLEILAQNPQGKKSSSLPSFTQFSRSLNCRILFQISASLKSEIAVLTEIISLDSRFLRDTLAVHLIGGSGLGLCFDGDGD